MYPIGQSGPEAPRSNDDWLRDLRATGRRHDDAVRSLHALMVRAARHQVARLRSTHLHLSSVAAEDIVAQVADDAVVTILGKLDSFEGRSRFTTWAYKFAILKAGVEVRRTVWKHREITVDVLPEIATDSPTPVEVVEGSELAAAVARAIETELTPHQRRVAVALLVDEVPIDVLAERLGRTRNALYKTLHDARTRLRRCLIDEGHLPGPTGTTSQSTAGAAL